MRELRERADWYNRFRCNKEIKKKFYLWYYDSIKLKKLNGFSENVIKRQTKQNVFDALVKYKDKRVIKLSKF